MKTSTWCALGGAVALLVATPRPAAADCVPGFSFAAFGKDNIGYGGGSTTGSFSSAVGAYGVPASNASTTSGGNIGTNSSSCAAVNTAGVSLTGASTTIGGNIQTGVGSTACTVSGSPPATVTAGTTPQTSNTVFTSVVIPAQIGTNNGSFSGSGTLSPLTNNYWDTITVSPSGSLVLSGGVYVMDNMTLKGTVTVTAPTVIYLRCNISSDAVTMSGTPNINDAAPQKSTNLVFMLGPNCLTADFQGGTNAAFAVYGPDTDISIHGGTNLYGSVVGKEVVVSGGVRVVYDTALANFVPGGYTCAGSEISRASPVIAAITPNYGGAAQNSLVQGTFVPPAGAATTITDDASIVALTFPYMVGHMRATIASTVSTGGSYLTGTACTAANTPTGCSVLFDAGATGMIPAPNSVSTTPCASAAGSCRYVFTNTDAAPTTGVQFHPTKTVIAADTVTANLVGSRITTGLTGPFTVARYQALMTKLLSANLGGVDRSTVAVIPPSSYAGSGTRATMAYFGATDGMLHAVCASKTGACAGLTLGKELWAFLPRVQLPLIATNTTRIDGSVRVIDAFGDFTNNPATGTKSWRTILTFQTGYAGTSTPAVYALDVTDPANPIILWEYTQPTTVGSTALGVGLTVTAGPTLVGGSLNNIAMIQTSNGGTSGAGVYATALSLETGSPKWTTPFTYLYSTAARYSAGDQTALARGIPGGGVAVDLGGQGYVTDFVMGDIFGNLWRLNALDGASRNGTNTPLFSFSTNYHPIGATPAIYSNGSQQFAAFASGGYVDPIATTYSTANQYVMAVKLASTAATISETSSACASCAVALKADLTGSKGFSQLLVVGGQLFVTSSAVDVNSSSYGSSTSSTGTETIANLGTLAVTTTTAIFAGGSSLANNGTTMYSSSSQKQQQLSSATSTVGASVELTAALKVFRDLWLRSE